MPLAFLHADYLRNMLIQNKKKTKKNKKTQHFKVCSKAEDVALNYCQCFDRGEELSDNDEGRNVI